MIEKLNSLPAGVLIGILITGLPIWIYAEKKVEQRTTTNNAVSSIKADISAIRDSHRILHQRITDTDKDAENDRKEIERRLRSLEWELKGAQLDIAALKAKP